MRSGLVWALSVAVLAAVALVAAIIAMTVAGVPHQSAPPPRKPAITGATWDEVSLMAPRANAALASCPSAAAGAPNHPTGPLAGIIVPCLGRPGPADLAAALAGRPALVNLWASWCAPCRGELPVLAAYASQPGAVAVIGINVQDNPATALHLLAELGVHYPSVIDTNQAFRKAMRLPPVLPVSVLLRADGSIQRVIEPLVFHSPDDIRGALQRLGAGGVPTN